MVKRLMNPNQCEHFDVILVGAGISGVGSAYHLLNKCPGVSFAILEAEDSFGGTWWTHRSPGIRSDSDLHTFGYSFKPWVGPPIATAEEILAYMREVIEENHIDQYIRYGHRITDAAWSHAESLWTLQVTNQVGERQQFTCNFLWMCQGYYRHNEGYTPDWPGMDAFEGQIAHPENWPTDLEYSKKRVVVIGSGATAATVVPAMAHNAAHVTMLQRSPTFFRLGRNAIDLVEELRTLHVDEAWIHEITRRKILYEQAAFTEMCIEKPDEVKQMLIGEIKKVVGDDFDVDKHFTPTYRPWRQRIAFVPDADLFKAIANKQVSVVTDEIERFVESGIELKSGETLEADVIVTATGFNMNIMGDINFSIDGETLNFHDTVTYRGTMFTGVPNLAWVFGYFRASWTLRTDLVAEFVCRMLNHMQSKGASSIEPQLRAAEQDMERLPWIDEQDFNPNYLLRAMHLLPKRGPTREWQHTQDYWREKDEFPEIDLDDEVFRYRFTDSASGSVAAE